MNASLISAYWRCGIARPHELAKDFYALEPNFDLLHTWRKKEQREYLRRRLRAIELLWEGESRSVICAKLDIHRDTLLEWVKVLVANGVQEGLRRLIQAKPSPKPHKLPPAAQEELPKLLETSTPLAHGYRQPIFTGKLLRDWIAQRYQIQVSSQTVYNFLHWLRFSYQRAHRDYLNADPQAQKRYGQLLYTCLRNLGPGERLVFFDEFAVTNRPTLFYGWARTNTRFQVPSNERNRQRLNGLLSVDAFTGQTFMQLLPRAKTLDLVPYFCDLARDTLAHGADTLTVILDNCPTHKDTLRFEVWQALRAAPDLQHFTLRWVNTPTYSPELNLAEYLIHQIRLQLLHQLPATWTLEEIETHLREGLEAQELQTPEQITHTLNHIFKLCPVDCRI